MDIPKIHSYPKVWNLGHPHIADLFKDPVVVEEKVDGSQFSFAVLDDMLVFRSRKSVVRPEAPDMFSLAVENISSIAGLLTPGWVYRGEYLSKPKHNTLHYDRVPKSNVVVWDIESGPNQFLSRPEKEAEAARLGLELVPLIYDGVVESPEAFEKLLDQESFLGGPKVEGLVFKNYHHFGEDGKILAGKHVSEAFKEHHRKDWKNRHPGQNDIKLRLGEYLRNEARWEKAIQRLRDEGMLQQAPQDIGPLLKEVKQDIQEEMEAEIKEKLYQWAIKDVLRGAVRGLPEWYKEKLVQAQFEGE